MFNRDPKFEERGIDPDVVDGAFFPYDQGDEPSLRAAYAACDGAEPSATDIARATRASGIVMRRFPVPGGNPDISPEMRPDWSVLTPMRMSRKFVFPHTHAFLRPTERTEHVRRGKTRPTDVVRACTPDELDTARSWLWDAEWAVNEGGDHFGTDPGDALHVHIPIAKYLFKASPVSQVNVRPHVHAEEFGENVVDPGAEQQPLGVRMWVLHSRHHMTVDDHGEMVDDGTPWDADHTHPIDLPDRSVPIAKRLSWHPYHRASRWLRKRVLFALEGCLKEAALVSADEATFSCPSVSLWNAPELEPFARSHLVGKQVFVVCDSDWNDGDHEQVVRQTLMARDTLRRHVGDVHGEYVHACAPPATDCAEHDGKHGVDDFIGHGGKIDDLDVFDLIPEVSLVEHLAATSTSRRPHASGRKRDDTVLQWVQTHCEPNDGHSRVSLAAMGRWLQRELESPSPDAAARSAQRAVASLDDYGALSIVEPLRERYRWDSLGRRREWTGKVQLADHLRPRVAVRKLYEM
jgi:hypothetical protein